ncbi:hypothetical protein AB0B71_16375 [Micromonospora echinofusca]|uniref:hypothetical protein n=1 Tax=Micromonospora echinofusca TaxID=47858 RepID=UPI0033F4C424
MPRDPQAIEQFMWGYQSHFRMSVKHTTMAAFEAIGFNSRAYVALVGFQVAGEHKFAICVEPEDGPYSPADFAGVTERAADLYRQHPDFYTFNTDPGVHERRHRALQREMRAQAITEVLSAHPASAGLTFFASMPNRVGDYEVHTVVGVRTSALEGVPQLRTTRRDRFRITPSFVHALLDEILYRATTALYIPDAGAGLNALGVGTPELVRSATERFVRCVFICAGSWFGQDTDLLLNALSALPYEGRSGLGFLLLAAPETPGVDVVMRLGNPVRLGNTRAVRKLLEASGDNIGLLAGELRGGFGGSVYALGSIGDDYDATSETVFVVSILGRGAWDLEHSGEAMLSVRDGVAQLPARTLDASVLRDSIERTLPDADVDRLVSLAAAAELNDHGAMLIISGDAASEARRLSPQAWSVGPAEITPKVISQLTAMDGAVLVDPQGRCHAIGVILDGRADNAGDPSRGSRYNNTVRYLGSQPPPCVIIVYSSDRTVDIFPRLMPKVSRVTVEEALSRYLRLAAERPPHFEWTHEAQDDLAKYKFYLSQEQCDQVNAAVVALNHWRMSNHGMSIGHDDWAPNPDMDDSYWRNLA